MSVGYCSVTLHVCSIRTIRVKVVLVSRCLALQETWLMLSGAAFTGDHYAGSGSPMGLRSRCALFFSLGRHTSHIWRENLHAVVY